MIMTALDLNERKLLRFSAAK